MARTPAKKSKRKIAKKTAPQRPRFRPFAWLLAWVVRLVLLALAFAAIAIVAFTVINPSMTPYMYEERQRLGAIEHEWVDWDDIASVMPRSAVAAEDANYCLHWGLDVTAIERALEDGRGGASTISQQVVKNVYLWHGRSWFRKALEAVITPAVELVWTKERILEVYLNVAEFDEGVFGVGVAARHYFGVDAADLTPIQAARLAAILPSPKSRSASNPSDFVRSRANSIRDGAATIARDGRAGCFE